MPGKKDKPESVVYSVNLVLLLVSLVLVLMIAPVFESFWFGSLLLYGVITLTLIVGGGLASNRRKQFWLALALAVLAVPTLWTSAVVDWPLLFVISCTLNGLFGIVLAGLLLVRVLRQYIASWHSIAGAVAAYLLLGLAWANFYWATERMDSEHVAFSQSERMVSPLTGSEMTAFSQMVYFSFVTMSTLGYGDVTPQTSLVRTLAWMQAVTGQFYIAVLVARLVAEIRLHAPAPRHVEQAAD